VVTYGNYDDRTGLSDRQALWHAIVPQASDEAGPAPAATADQTPAAVPAPPSFVYAIGRVEPRFPTTGLEKELAQATGRIDSAGRNDRDALRSVVTEPANRYLVRGLAWVLTVEGLETYLLTPRDPADFAVLAESLRPNPRPTDIDVVIGMLGPMAPPEYANGLVLPIVAFDQMFSFDTDTLISNIPRPDSFAEEDFRPAAEETYERLVQIADNAGNTDEHRALNYLAVRYPAVYARTAEAFARDFALASVHTQRSRLSGPRRIVDVILTYRNRTSDFEESAFVRVDVTEEFPFLVTKLNPYFRR